MAFWTGSKKVLLVFMTIMMLMSVSIVSASPVFAEGNGSKGKTEVVKITEDLKQKVETYVTVKNKRFHLDVSALRKNVSKQEFHTVKQSIKKANKTLKNVDQSKLTKTDDNTLTLSIQKKEGTTFRAFTYCAGKTTALDYHWWGYSRYLDHCDAGRLAADLASIAAGYGGAGIVLSAFFPLPGIVAGLGASYAALMAARITANDYGRGVYAEVTWAFVFDITPQ